MCMDITNEQSSILTKRYLDIARKFLGGLRNRVQSVQRLAERIKGLRKIQRESGASKETMICQLKNQLEKEDSDVLFKEQ
mgnify:CR=1 FL=1